MYKLLSTFCFLLILISVNGQKAYKIQLEVADTSLSEVYLGYHFADKQYIIDTAKIHKGKFTFEGAEEWEPGVYLLIMPPSKKYLEVLLDKGDQNLSVIANYHSPSKGIKIKGSDQNIAFYEYINDISKSKKRAEDLNSQLKLESANKESIEAELLSIDEYVANSQKEIFSRFEGKMLAHLVKSGIQIEIPEMTGNENEVRSKRYRYYKKHYFDQIDLSNDNLIRTPFLFSKITNYVSKLTPQIPDSINKSLDFVLSRMNTDGESFKFFLVHYINEYNKSDIVGMDGVFVHLADTYYRTGKASWTSEESLKKILKRASSLKPILIGKKAPDFEFTMEDGSSTTLYDVESPYTVLFFWDPKCGHCKKQMPHAIKFYEEYKDKGVKFIAICTKREGDVNKCWEMVKEKGMDVWINGYDPYVRYKPLYDIIQTPQIFVLDKEKRIAFKRINAKQLTDVMKMLNGEEVQRVTE